MPSGSAKNTNLPHGNSCTSPTSTPRAQELIARGVGVVHDQLQTLERVRCDEYYESPAGIARHWQDTTENWPEMSSAAPAWFAKATIATLHNGTAVQAL